MAAKNLDPKMAVNKKGDHTNLKTTTGKNETDASSTTASLYAKKPPVASVTPLTLQEYASNRARRGQCLIVNNHHFNTQLTKQIDRDGTEVDADAIERCFMSLGFEVTRYNDLTTTDMSINLRQAAEEDHSDADCFVCVILSHGEDGSIYGTNGRMQIDQLTNRFKGDVCPTLAGKPKIFIIQACRGRRYDFGVESTEDFTDSGESLSVRRIPIEADVLMAYSVVPGHFSWRNNVDGSWYIQALCRVLRECGETMEITQIMTLVNRIVALDFESCTDEEFTTGMKQVPCFASTLTKLLYFRQK